MSVVGAYVFILVITIRFGHWETPRITVGVLPNSAKSIGNCHGDKPAAGIGETVTF